MQRRRQKVRLLQQRKAAEVIEFKDLPEEIPLPLVIGTRVTGEWEIPLSLVKHSLGLQHMSGLVCNDQHLHNLVPWQILLAIFVTCFVVIVSW